MCNNSRVSKCKFLHKPKVTHTMFTFKSALSFYFTKFVTKQDEWQNTIKYNKKAKSTLKLHLKYQCFELFRTLLQKSRIWETLNLSTDADSSTDAIGGWTKNTPKPTSYQYNRLISKYNRLMLLYNRLTETGPQNQQQKKLFFVRQFLTIFKQKCLNMRPLLSITFPQGFRIS